MKTLTRQQHLLDQQLALGAYLDALLEETLPQQARERAAPQAPAAAPGTQPAAAEVAAVPSVAAAAAAQHSAAQATSTAGVPEWAATRFQALLFEVAGLTLAVPLVKLKGVVSHAAEPTPMPGQSPLFAGLVPYQGLQARVVDTARFVLPEDRAAQLDDNVMARCDNLVMIDAGRWALACSRIGDVIELDSADVKWRSSGGKRLWLAGTVIERMCALLDIDALCQELGRCMA